MIISATLSPSGCLRAFGYWVLTLGAAFDLLIALAADISGWPVYSTPPSGS